MPRGWSRVFLLLTMVPALLADCVPVSAAQLTKNLTVDAGSKRLISSHSHFSLQTCGTMSIPKVILKTRPTKGDIAILPEALVLATVDTKRGNSCLGRSVQGVAIYYTARRDAVGGDEFAYVVQYPANCKNCTAKEITAKISIASSGRAATVDSAGGIAAQIDDERTMPRDDAETEIANRVATEELERGDAKPMLVPAIGLPSAVADDTTCFSLGTDDYKRTEVWSEGMRACNRVISSGNVAGERSALYYLGRAYWKHLLRDFDGALDDCNQAINLDPKHVEGYDYRADAWKAKGQIDRAIGDYEMAIRIDPKYAAAYYGRGRIYEREGSIDKARADYNAAVAVPQKDRVAKWAQIQARERLSELDK